MPIAQALDQASGRMDNISPCRFFKPCFLFDPGPCYTGGRILVPDAVRHQVEDWLEWEERVLRPAVHSRQPVKLQAALSQLDQACASGQAFLGHGLTLADIVIFSCLQGAKDTAEASLYPSACQDPQHRGFGTIQI